MFDKNFRKLLPGMYGCCWRPSVFRRIGKFSFRFYKCSAMQAFPFALSLLATITFLAFSPIASAQGNCQKQASVIEIALCEQSDFRILSASLARNSVILQKHCHRDKPRPSDAYLSHASWLSKVSATYGRLTGIVVRDFLGSVLTQRADELAQALSSCSHELARNVKSVRIDTVKLPIVGGQVDASSLPFVRTVPALVGIRINDALYRKRLNMEAPASPRDEDVRQIFSGLPKPSTESELTNETLKASVLWRTVNLLLLQVETSGCESRCWENNDQLLFDLRTGDQVEPVDLLSLRGRRALDHLVERSVSQKARQLRKNSKAQWEADGMDTFDRCMNEWKDGYAKGGMQVVWTRDKRWFVGGPTCSGDGDAAPPAINSKYFSITELAPNLSAYGKSLLLGEGDVRSPVEPIPACVAPKMPPDPQGWGKRIADISSGSDHVYLREHSGRVWGWGRNYDDALGNVGVERSTDWMMPFVIGDDYRYAGAGQFFSVALKRDGTLWSWGSGYHGRLGDGAEHRSVPKQIGENFIYADVDNYGGRALAKDGRLWEWGSHSPRMQVVAHDVKQVGGSDPILFLKQDGGLWSLRDVHWKPPGKTDQELSQPYWYGTDFVRFPASPTVALGWRADGTAWAWGRTLTAMATLDNLPGIGESPWPRFVGKDWIDVKSNDDKTLVSARKSDGTLWVSQDRGGSVRMLSLGCGFIDMAVVHDKFYGAHLLALRSDGALLDYHSGLNDGGSVRRNLLLRPPKVLANDGVKLFQGSRYWGGSGGHEVHLLRQNGTLWRWYGRFGTVAYTTPDRPPVQRLELVEFPEKWFAIEALRR